jgi:Uma2 family endonuclease
MISRSNTEVTELSQRSWSVADYHQMIASGILTTHDHTELLNGQILEMTPQAPDHASTTSSVGNDLVTLFAGRAWVRQQLPITIEPDSEPEPDIALVRIDPNRYRDRHPSPTDIYLLIEVADSTLNYDRTHKTRVYAKANILEYWVVDLKRKRVLMFSEPQNGVYHVQRTEDFTTPLMPIAFPGIAIALDYLASETS